MKHPETIRPSRRPVVCLFACMMLAVSMIAAAAPKRIPTHEDIWLMKRVGAPQVSPDGRWIVVSVVEPAYDDNAQLSDLCATHKVAFFKASDMASSGIASGAASDAWKVRGPDVQKDMAELGCRF